MKIICQKTELAKYLPIATNVTPARAVLSTLQSLLLTTAGDNHVSIVATDLDCWLRCNVPATVLEPGAATIDARLFNALAHSFVGEQITIESDSDDKTVVISGDDAQYKLAMLDIDSFPEWPYMQRDGLRWRVDKSALINALDNTLYAVSVDKTRQIITGVLFEPKPDGLRLVATDTHRMAICDCQDVKMHPNDHISFVLSADFARDVAKIADAADTELVDIYCASEPQQRHIVFFDFAGQIFYSAKLLEGLFPPYERVIPTDFAVTAVYNKLTLLNILKRIRLVADKETDKLVLSVTSDSTHIRVDTEIAHADERIDCDVDGVTDNGFEIAFSCQYLIEAIEPVAGSSVTIQFTSPESPAVIHDGVGDKYRAIVMPMRM